MQVLSYFKIYGISYRFGVLKAPKVLRVKTLSTPNFSSL
jgi:hypothetical protein